MNEQQSEFNHNGGPVRIVKLRIGSRREFLDGVHSLSEHLIEEVGFSADDTYWMVTAVREAVTNAVIHGNKEQPGTRVDVVFELADECIRITVVDQGSGFDPDSLPDPVSKEHLMDASGRGVFLMHQLMDDVTYDFPESGGCTLTMTKRRRIDAENGDG